SSVCRSTTYRDLHSFPTRRSSDLGGLPYYVVGKDMDKNEVYVTRDLNDDSLWRKEIQLGSLHWINGTPGDGEYQVRVRHRAPLRSEEHTSELQSRENLVCRLLLEK